MKIILVLSLMLNVVGIGAVGARAWMVHKHGHGVATACMRSGFIHSCASYLRERRKELRVDVQDHAFGELRRQGHSLLLDP